MTMMMVSIPVEPAIRTKRDQAWQRGVADDRHGTQLVRDAPRDGPEHDPPCRKRE